MNIRFVAVIFLLIISFSCNNISEKAISPPKPGKEEMADLNRYLVRKDRERIQNYIERKNLKMTESQTGLWFCIINEGEGDYLKDSRKISMEYDCSLLDGTKCYSSTELGPKELILGRSQMEPGMNEGLRLLKSGGEAIFIIPPFLGYGFVGDGKMIPSRAIVVYNVHILQAR